MRRDLGTLLAPTGGVNEPGLAHHGKLKLVGQLGSNDRLAAGSGVDDEAEWAPAVDGDHYIRLAVDDFHARRVGEICAQAGSGESASKTAQALPILGRKGMCPPFTRDRRRRRLSMIRAGTQGSLALNSTAGQRICSFK